MGSTTLSAWRGMPGCTRRFKRGKARSKRPSPAAARSSARSASSTIRPPPGTSSAASSPAWSSVPGSQSAFRGDQPRSAGGRALRRPVLPARRGREPDQGDPARSVRHPSQQPEVLANWLRILFSALAYTLLQRLREMGLASTERAAATAASIRVKLLKIGAAMVRNTRRIRILFASHHPLRQSFSPPPAHWPLRSRFQVRPRHADASGAGGSLSRIHGIGRIAVSRATPVVNLAFGPCRWRSSGGL